MAIEWFGYSVDLTNTGVGIPVNTLNKRPGDALRLRRVMWRWIGGVNYDPAQETTVGFSISDKANLGLATAANYDDPRTKWDFQWSKAIGGAADTGQSSILSYSYDFPTDDLAELIITDAMLINMGNSGVTAPLSMDIRVYWDRVTITAERVLEMTNRYYSY